MPQEPMSYFGWLLSCCINDDTSKQSGEALSAAVLFASGMVASVVTIYVVGMFHLM
jgi:hypothetical protein